MYFLDPKSDSNPTESQQERVGAWRGECANLPLATNDKHCKSDLCGLAVMLTIHLASETVSSIWFFIRVLIQTA